MPSRTSSYRPVRRLALASCLAAGLAVGPIAATTPPATAAAADDAASRFTLAVLPDTQFYSRYSADQFMPRYGSDPFAVQTEWLATHADDLNIPFVAHVGDVVDRATVAAEWQAADAAMRTLDDAPLPYSVLPGNHDVTNSGLTDAELIAKAEAESRVEPYVQWFGPDRAAGQSTYKGSDPLGMSQFHVFEAEGQRFMSLAVAWKASDATLDWANEVIAAHPDIPVILTTHALLGVGPDQETPVETVDSERIWEKLIRGNDQIFMTLNGHFHGATKQVRTNDAGNAVHQILIDYQMAYEGGNGYLGLFEFDLTNNTLSLETVSPWVVDKPQNMLTSYDQPLLEGAQQRYTLDLDFADRFSGFTDTFTAGSPDEPSLTQKARDILLDGFEGPDPITTEQPGDERDFVEVEGTLAHWRFNGLEGVVDADTVVEDVAGDNDLRRVDPALTDAVGAEWADVTIEDENVHGFSSDGAAVCFDNASATRFSYLTTAADAAVNDADLADGYTLETFVKMDADWDAGSNGWSKAVVRTGNRSQMGAPETRWDWTASPTALGISNLREFQFTSLPADTSLGDRVNWSGEIMVDTWSHVAIVNDAEAATTTMYVDGAPVLRNATDVAGMAGAGLPWILGSDWVDDAARNGWHGCIGETRIIDHPTTADQWLTQRADIDGLTVDEAPEGELPADTATVRFAGTGLPGADVNLSAFAGGSGMARTAVDLSGATTTVAADGTWEIVVDAGLSAGSHTVAISQALGERAAEPAVVSFSIAAAPAPEPTGTASPEPQPEPTTPPAGEPAASGGDTDADLAATGYDAAGIGALIAVALAALGAGTALLIARARRRVGA